MKTSLFCHVTQGTLVVSYRRFGTAYISNSSSMNNPTTGRCTFKSYRQQQR